MAKRTTNERVDFDRILRPAEVARLLGIHPATLWRMVGRGDLPRPRRIGLAAVGWRAREIDQWIDSRPAA